MFSYDGLHMGMNILEAYDAGELMLDILNRICEQH